MHVADLDALPTSQTSRWTAVVRIRVHTGAEETLSSAVVRGTWSTGATSKCKTGSAGGCQVSLSRLSKTLASVTFTVTSVTRSGRTYVPSANHDPDGDSDGTTIEVLRP